MYKIWVAQYIDIQKPQLFGEYETWDLTVNAANTVDAALEFKIEDPEGNISPTYVGTMYEDDE